MSLDVMVHHPLFALARPGEWSCRTVIDNFASIRLRPRPCKERSPHFSEEACEGAIGTWLRRRRVRVEHRWPGLIDLQGRRKYVPDLLCELRGRALVVIIYTSVRRRGVERHRMRAFAKDVLDLCRTAYHCGADVALLNGYGRGRVEGEIIQGCI